MCRILQHYLSEQVQSGPNQSGFYRQLSSK